MDRVKQIKRKYGERAFQRWGRLGGNPVLMALRAGHKVTIHKKKRR